MRIVVSSRNTHECTRCVCCADPEESRKRAAVSTQPKRIPLAMDVEDVEQAHPSKRRRPNLLALEYKPQAMQRNHLALEFKPQLCMWPPSLPLLPKLFSLPALLLDSAWQTMTQPRSANQMSSKKRVSDDSEYKCEMKRRKLDFTAGPPSPAHAPCAFLQWRSSLLGTKRKPLEEVFPTRNVKRMHVEYDLHEIDAY